MRTTALRFLCCPECHQDLRLEPRHVDEGQVESGWLVCAVCPEAYPIVRGVPRFVRADRRGARHDLQWRIFRAMPRQTPEARRAAERMLGVCTGWPAPAFCRRLILDVGSGTGRFAEAAANLGSEVVGVDFNAAVDLAHAGLRAHANVHLVQADLSALPLRDGIFDLAYSLGVLPHTPDPAATFASIARAVKPSGELAILLTGRRRLPSIVRRVTQHLPLSVSLALTAAAIPRHYLRRLPILRHALEPTSPLGRHDDWRRCWLDAFAWYTASYEWTLGEREVMAWFAQQGFTNVQATRGLAGLHARKASELCAAPIPRATDTGRAAAAVRVLQPNPRTEVAVGYQRVAR